jgi:hypothetical protein
VGYACHDNLKVLTLVLPTSLLHAGFETPIACLIRPSEEKLAARASAAARLLFFEALAAYSLPRSG